MALRYSRQACLARLRAEIATGRAVVMTGAGNGLAAKFIERGGVDLIGVYNTGYFRMQGYVVARRNASHPRCQRTGVPHCGP